MLTIALQSRQPIYEQLILRLSEVIAVGALAPDAQLPSVRNLARDLGVNPNTVQKAKLSEIFIVTINSQPQPYFNKHRITGVLRSLHEIL